MSAEKRSHSPPEQQSDDPTEPEIQEPKPSIQDPPTQEPQEPQEPVPVKPQRNLNPRKKPTNEKPKTPSTTKTKSAEPPRSTKTRGTFLSATRILDSSADEESVSEPPVEPKPKRNRRKVGDLIKLHSPKKHHRLVNQETSSDNDNKSESDHKEGMARRCKAAKGPYTTEETAIVDRNVQDYQRVYPDQR
jgi:hypothetical protein